MTDTTTTITPDERAEWRKRVERLRKELRSAYADGNNRVDALTEENARLRAERDWLAENIADRPCAYDSCPFGLQRPTGPDDDCDKTRAQCWQEAASRAVAESEVRE